MTMSRRPFRKLYALEERQRRVGTRKWGPWLCIPAHLYTDLDIARREQSVLSGTFKGMRIYGEEIQVRVTHFVREKAKNMWQEMKWREGKR